MSGLINDLWKKMSSGDLGQPSGPDEDQRPGSASGSGSGSGSASASSSRRYNLQLRECIETRTVTTTTRLTRQYPNVIVQDSHALENLDSKEYPLARQPPPPEIANFSFNASPGNRSFGILSQKPQQQLLRDDSLVSESPSVEDSRDTSTTSVDKSTDNASALFRRSRTSRPESPASTSNSPTPSQRATRSMHNTRSTSDAMRRALAHSGGTSSPSGTALRLRRATQDRAGCLATPDTSELAGGVGRSSRRQGSLRAASEAESSGPSNLSLVCDATSPAPSDAHTFLGSNVATPPITDTDAEPFTDSDEVLQDSIRALQNRSSIDTAAAQDASLPSPRLSPTLAAAQLHHDDSADSSGFQNSHTEQSTWYGESQEIEDSKSFDSIIDAAKSDNEAKALVRRGRDEPGSSDVIVDPQMLLDSFSAMNPSMKNFMMYEFLRRCSRPMLRVIANAVNPALKCDFLHQLPLELSYHILSYLDHRDLCRAAQVSKRWRSIIDQNETGWKELFDRDQYQLHAGEFNRAIAQGWGWQDPEGANGYEKDLSMQQRLTSSQEELNKTWMEPEVATVNKRAMKRKRGLNAYTPSSSTKRRAFSSSNNSTSERAFADRLIKPRRAEGPISAANAAVVAVPDPGLGLPSLRQMHLYKSLYRRHHMIRHSWTSGKVKPAHLAFQAHPRHVITCLQFDEDKIITGSDDTFIHVYDTKTGALLKKLQGHEGGVWALQYYGNTLVSGSTDRTVRVWDIERGLCQQIFWGHTSTVRCLQILMPEEIGKNADGSSNIKPDKPLIITGSRDSQLRVWRLPGPGSKRYMPSTAPADDFHCPFFIRAMTGHNHSVRAIAAHGDTLVSGSYDTFVRVWRISTGESLHVLQGHAQKVYSVVLDHERNRCISGSMDSLVKIWDLDTGACLYTLEGHSLLVGLLDLRDDRLVSAAADSTLRIWDPQTGRCRNTLSAHTGAITCFQHDGQKVVSGSEKTVKMWDVQTGQCIQDLLTDLSGVWQVKFDNRRCVAAVQREQLTYIEILDFGAVRDGRPPEELGKRMLYKESDPSAPALEVDDDDDEDQEDDGVAGVSLE